MQHVCSYSERAQEKGAHVAPPKMIYIGFTVLSICKSYIIFRTSVFTGTFICKWNVSSSLPSGAKIFRQHDTSHADVTYLMSKICVTVYL